MSGENKTKYYAINVDTLFKVLMFSILFTVVVALFLMHQYTDTKQDINTLEIKINNKVDKDNYNKHISEYAVNNEKTLFNEQIIIKGLDMDSETFHEYFIERMKDGKRQIR